MPCKSFRTGICPTQITNWHLIRPMFVLVFVFFCCFGGKDIKFHSIIMKQAERWPCTHTVVMYWGFIFESVSIKYDRDSAVSEVRIDCVHLTYT